MRPNLATTDIRRLSVETTCETFLLGRLSSELARIYGDTVHAPLPSRLQALIDRLDEACKAQGIGQSEQA